MSSIISFRTDVYLFVELQNRKKLYLTTKEPLIYYPECMYFGWRNKDGDIYSNQIKITVEVHTQPTKLSDKITIIVTSNLKHDEAIPSHENTIIVDKPCKSVDIKVDEVYDIKVDEVNTFKERTNASQYFSQKNDMTHNIDYHIDFIWY